MIDIFIIGDYNIDDMEKIVSEHFKINTIKNNKVSHFLEQKSFRKSIKQKPHLKLCFK